MAYSVNSFKKYVLSPYSLAGTMLETGEKMIKKSKILVCLRVYDYEVIYTQLVHYNTVITTLMGTLSSRKGM